MAGILATSAPAPSAADPTPDGARAAVVPDVQPQRFRLEAYPPRLGAGLRLGPVFLDRPRTCWDGQARHVRRLPGRRAAGWSCRRRTSVLSLPPSTWPGLHNARASFSPSDDGAQTSIPAPRERGVTRLEGSSRDLCGCPALLGWQPCTSRPRAERMLSKSTRGSQDEGRCAGAPGEAAESGTRHPFRDQVWLGATA